MADSNLYRVGDVVYDGSDPRKPRTVATWMKGAWYHLKRGKTSMEYDMVPLDMQAEMAKVRRVG